VLLLRLKGAAKQITVHVIAHSMGNRVLARALEHLGNTQQGAGARTLREVAMMAPDIDATLFRQVAGKIPASSERVTLYASEQDSTLRAAQRLAGYSRAGAGRRNLVVVPGIETVDASSVQNSLLGLGHSYYADNSTAPRSDSVLSLSQPRSPSIGGSGRRRVKALSVLTVARPCKSHFLN
jgi:esterase/lipase superfamily enzyme